MKSKMSFQERAALGMMQLAKQPPVTLEEALQQVEWVQKHFPHKKAQERQKSK